MLFYKVSTLICLRTEALSNKKGVSLIASAGSNLSHKGLELQRPNLGY